MRKISIRNTKKNLRKKCENNIRKKNEGKKSYVISEKEGKYTGKKRQGKIKNERK